MRVPLRSKHSNDASVSIADASLQLHPYGSGENLLVKFLPAAAPSDSIDHVPCDITLVIDVSGSMGAYAPVPGESGESTGLSILDLVKHAAATIIETLDEGDRLGIVTFTSRSTILQGLTPMTDDQKVKAREKIEAMQPLDTTSLWFGLRDGLKVAQEQQRGRRASAIMVLTDGMPNHMCPPAGYVPKLRTMLPFSTTIHTFGFGYSLRSGLLKSIAEMGNGNYAFIPDAGMIGTVFVHAVANLQSTFATDAVLQITYRKPLKVEECMGSSALQVAVSKTSSVDSGPDQQLTIPLGYVQYGQSRDIVLRVDKSHVQGDDAIVCVQLTARRTVRPPGIDATKGAETPDIDMTASTALIETSGLDQEELDYHESRARVCDFLSSIFPIGSDGEHRVCEDRELKMTELNKLVEDLPAQRHGDEKNESLVQDLVGAEPKGQISLAIRNADFFHRWGVHYLPSYLNAHTRQICNSFKDSGPLQYGTDSPLFMSCRDKLDAAFDNLRAPTPSLVRGHVSHTPLVSMTRYHNSNAPCFAGATLVLLANGRKVPIKELTKGMRLATPRGSRKVSLVLKTAVSQYALCRIGDLVVTPWHPISLDTETWCFPGHSIHATAVEYTGSIYSILLEKDEDSAAHAMLLGDSRIWGVTLGHGIRKGNDDVRAHEFFGEYDLVKRVLKSMGVKYGGIVRSIGVERDEKSGLVCGFTPEVKQ